MATNDVGRSVTRVARVLTYFVYVWVVINEIILTLGFFLELFGANPDAAFTQWAYRNLERVMAPFRGIFPSIEITTAGGDVKPVFDTSILFAMLVYGILALALRSLIDWLAYRIRVIDARRAQEEYEAKLAAYEQAQAQQAAQATTYTVAMAPTVQGAGAETSIAVVTTTPAPGAPVPAVQPPPAAPGSAQ